MVGIEPTAGNTPVSTQLRQAKNGSTEPIAGNYTRELSTLSSQNGYNTATNESEFPLGVPGNPTLIILVPMFLPYVFCYSSTKKNVGKVSSLQHLIPVGVVRTAAGSSSISYTERSA